MDSNNISILFGDDFPYEDTLQISQTLTETKALIPGYFPPEAGFLSLESLLYEQRRNTQFTVLPDLNLISELTKLANQNLTNPINHPCRVAVNLMAFSQAMNIDIEPSIAFHEYASNHGNTNAHERLAWFRSADRANANTWIDLALERINSINLEPREALGHENLAFPLKRWKRNYVVALKIAELELSEPNNLNRYQSFLTWMRNEFFIAGPAAIYAALYFAPNAERKGLFKQLRAKDRERAIKGIKNAAWDITHLSDFVLRVGKPDQNRRYILATGDKLLAEIAPILLLQPESSRDQPSIEAALATWWPNNSDAQEITTQLKENIHYATKNNLRNSGHVNIGDVNKRITTGEDIIRNWSQN